MHGRQAAPETLRLSESGFGHLSDDRAARPSVAIIVPVGESLTPGAAVGLVLARRAAVLSVRRWRRSDARCCSSRPSQHVALRIRLALCCVVRALKFKHNENDLKLTDGNVSRGTWAIRIARLCSRSRSRRSSSSGPAKNCWPSGWPFHGARSGRRSSLCAPLLPLDHLDLPRRRRISLGWLGLFHTVLQAEQWEQALVRVPNPCKRERVRNNPPGIVVAHFLQPNLTGQQRPRCLREDVGCFQKLLQCLLGPHIAGCRFQVRLRQQVLRWPPWQEPGRLQGCYKLQSST